VCEKAARTRGCGRPAWATDLGHVQIDEIWTFVQKKQGHLHGPEVNNPTIGDVYLFTALDTDSKLLVTFALGKRNSEVTETLIADLEKRLVRAPNTESDDRPQLSTVGFGPYPGAIARKFGRTVRHGVLIKNYVNPDVGRYAPPTLMRAERLNVQGIRDLGTICTSHVERNNLTIRTFMKRFTRLALGFSKKLENLATATALHVATYNFCRIHGSLNCTPAMAAGVIGELWSMGNLFDAVTQHAERQKRDARLAKLIDKLRRN
jgi:IS1 family transposase